MTKNVEDVFKVADKMDAVAFSELLTTDVKFRFSNNDLWTGREAVISGLNYLFSKINGLRHDLKGIYVKGVGYAVEAIANYTMKDGKVISLPVVSVLKYRGSSVEDYRIYMDISPVMTYAPS
ncbi:MAG: nuclear transport factor 2 family protein [Candidatus Thermoplasmatota archaeon]|jgi:ketosteroid isomerase-like protein|nr:nuclear transport factor 2 family protein [Candidatus Thermoplasmatota archaeon]